MLTSVLRVKPLLFCLAATLVGCSESPPTTSLEVAVDGLYSASINTNASHVVVGTVSHGGSWWQLNPAERLFDWNHNSQQYANITSAAISPDGRYAMTGETTTMVLWTTQTGENLTYFKAPSEIHSIALTDALGIGVIAALGLENQTATLFNASRGRVLATFNHGSRVRSVDISADGEWLLSGGDDQRAIFWSVREQQEVSAIQHGDDVRLVKLSGDHSLALSVSKYDKALVWNTKDGSVVGVVPNMGDAMRRGRTFSSARFNKDNTLLVTGASDRTVELWQLSDMSLLGRWTLPLRGTRQPANASVLDVAFNKEGDIIAVAGNGFIHTFKP